jgi:hypothetical protein
LNFVGIIGQAVRVNIDAYAATWTLHVFTLFQSPDALFKVMAAVRTLKFDDLAIDIWHRASFFVGWETGPALRTYRLRTAPFAKKASFLCRTTSIGAAETGRSLQTIKPNRSCRRCGYPIERIRARPYLSISAGISAGWASKEAF